MQSICFLLTGVVVLRHEGEHSRSGETQSHQEDQSGEKENIKALYIDTVVDGSVVMQRQKPLDAELLKDLRGLGKPLSFDGNETEHSGQKGPWNPDEPRQHSLSFNN